MRVYWTGPEGVPCITDFADSVVAEPNFDPMEALQKIGCGPTGIIGTGPVCPWVLGSPREEAVRWRDGQIMDDRRVTTAREMEMAWEHFRGRVAVTFDPAKPAHVKALMDKPDILTEAEAAQIVADWRVSIECPEVSRFAPPLGAFPVPRHFKVTGL